MTFIVGVVDRMTGPVVAIPLPINDFYAPLPTSSHLLAFCREYSTDSPASLHQDGAIHG